MVLVEELKRLNDLLQEENNELRRDKTCFREQGEELRRQLTRTREKLDASKRDRASLNQVMEAERRRSATIVEEERGEKERLMNRVCELESEMEVSTVCILWYPLPDDSIGTAGASTLSSEEGEYGRSINELLRYRTTGWACGLASQHTAESNITHEYSFSPHTLARDSTPLCEHLLVLHADV